MFKRVAGIVIVLAMASYLVFAVCSLTGSTSDGQICGDVCLRVQDSLDYNLVDRSLVLDLLNKKGVNPIGMEMERVNLDSMENVLERFPLIASAECYKTVGCDVKVKIHSSVPLVRVMPRSGADYMLDSYGRIIDSKICNVQVPVATGYISQTFASGKLIDVVRDIYSDDFWKDQTEQINVDQNGQIEIVPRVGNHIIEIGAPEDVADKLARVRRFYNEALNTVGWNKYSRISAVFEGQIVCKKR